MTRELLTCPNHELAEARRVSDMRSGSLKLLQGVILLRLFLCHLPQFCNLLVLFSPTKRCSRSFFSGKTRALVNILCRSKIKFRY